MQLKNIILDLGGVLYDLDYFKTQSALEELGLKEKFSQLNQVELFDDLEEGKITASYFTKQIVLNSSKSEVTEQEVIDAWNAMLLGMPAHRFQLLERLQSKYNLFLYSNTNEIHIKEVWNHLKVIHQLDDLSSYFKKVYLSNEMGIRKPKEEGFDLIVRENMLNKKETLFIDDSPQHVQGALRSGIHAEWLNLNEENIEQLLQRKNLI